MKTLIACLLLACVSFGQDTRTLDQVLESWREAVYLDLPGEVLRTEKDVLQRLPLLRKNGEALDLRVSARLMNSDPRGASEIIDATPLPEGEARYSKLALARVALFEDQLDEVSRLLKSKTTIEVDKELADLADAWLLLGRANARNANDKDAAFLLHEFIRHDPLHPEAASAWHFLARHAGRMQRSADARQYTIAAEQSTLWHSYYRARRIQVRENPTAILPRIGLVILWMQADRPQSAKEELERIFALEPDHCDAFGHLAEAERKLENFDAARKAYDRALECAPEKVGLRFNRAYLAGMQGRTADARADYEWIVKSEHETDPRFLTANLELARILLVAGESDESERHYARYVELGGKEPLTE